MTKDAIAHRHNLLEKLSQSSTYSVYVVKVRIEAKRMDEV